MKLLYITFIFVYFYQQQHKTTERSLDLENHFIYMLAWSVVCWRLLGEGPHHVPVVLGQAPVPTTRIAGLSGSENV